MSVQIDPGKVTTISPRDLGELVPAGTPGRTDRRANPGRVPGLHARPARLVPLDSLDPKAVMASRGDRRRAAVCRLSKR